MGGNQGKARNYNQTRGWDLDERESMLERQEAAVRERQQEWIFEKQQLDLAYRAAIADKYKLEQTLQVQKKQLENIEKQPSIKRDILAPLKEQPRLRDIASGNAFFIARQIWRAHVQQYIASMTHECNLAQLFHRLKVLSSAEKQSASNTVVILAELKMPPSLMTEIRVAIDKVVRIKPKWEAAIFSNEVVLKIARDPDTVNEFLDNSLEVERQIYQHFVAPFLASNYSPHVVGYLANIRCNIQNLHLPVAEQERLQNMMSIDRRFPGKIAVLVTERSDDRPLSQMMRAWSNPTQMYQMIFQIISTLYAFGQLGLKHHDLHFKNILVDELPEEMEFEYDMNINEETVHVIKTKWLPKIYDFDLASALYNRHIDRNAKQDMYFFCSEIGACNTRDKRYDVHGFIVGCYKMAKLARDTRVMSWIEEMIPLALLKQSESEEYVQNSLSNVVKRRAEQMKERIPTPFDYLSSLVNNTKWFKTFGSMKPLDAAEHAFIAPAFKESYTSHPTVSRGTTAYSYEQLLDIFQASQEHFLPRPIREDQITESVNSLLKLVINAFDKIIFNASPVDKFTRLYTQWLAECDQLGYEWNVRTMQLYLEYVDTKKSTFYNKSLRNPNQNFRSAACMAACMLLCAPQYYGLSPAFRRNLHTSADIPVFINDIFASFQYRLPVAVPALYKLELQ